MPRLASFAQQDIWEICLRGSTRQRLILFRCCIVLRCMIYYNVFIHSPVEGLWDVATRCEQ